MTRLRLFFLYGLLTGLVVAMPATGVEAVLDAARKAEERLETRRALELYQQADRLRPDDAFTLQKIAQQLSDLTLEGGGAAEKKARAGQALAYAKRAVELAPDNAVNVLSLAICYGKMGVYSDTRTKIEYSRLVRQEAERALSLDPNYDWAHHVLGRWHREVAELGAATRFFVRVVYGGLPDASKETAIRHLERAAALAPARVPHQVELGFAYRSAGRETDARLTFERALALPPKERYDASAQERARRALASAE
ncbi:MAG: hypothetical protein RLZZ50_365 [Verrucomicrobiota bacterium]|jgi:tetratricopeptide (TPR) repeat protein